MTIDPATMYFTIAAASLIVLAFLAVSGEDD